jgi:hypothetical protein
MPSTVLYIAGGIAALFAVYVLLLLIFGEDEPE